MILSHNASFQTSSSHLTTPIFAGLIAYQEKVSVIPWRWAASTFRSRAQSNTFSYNYIAILGRWLRVPSAWSKICNAGLASDSLI